MSNCMVENKKALPATSGLASGGVLVRGTLYRHFGSSPPVQAFVNPRPTAKPPGVGCKASGTADYVQYSVLDCLTCCPIIEIEEDSKYGKKQIKFG